MDQKAYLMLNMLHSSVSPLCSLLFILKGSFLIQETNSHPAMFQVSELWALLDQ